MVFHDVNLVSNCVILLLNLGFLLTLDCIALQKHFEELMQLAIEVTLARQTHDRLLAHASLHPIAVLLTRELMWED